MAIEIAELPRPAPALAVPSSDAEGIAARLAESNSHARSASIRRLRKWLPDYDVEAAAQNTDDRRFQALDSTDQGVGPIDDPGLLDRWVALHDLAPGRLGFARGDQRGQAARPPGTLRTLVPDRAPSERLAVGAAASALRDQWTLIINGIDDLDRGFGDLCDDIGRAFGCAVSANCYASSGPALGFGPHWDNHDTLIVPLTGGKRWRVYEPTVRAPLRPWTASSVSEVVVWEGLATPGRVLSIPRGWGHEVLGSDDLAVHVTIGINRIRAHHLFQRVEHEAGDLSAIRADLPYDLAEPIISAEPSVHEGALADLSLALGDAGVYERTVATYRARLPVRGWPSLLDTWRALGDDPAGLAVRVAPQAGAMLAGTTATAAVIAFGNKLITVDNRSFDTLAELCAAAPVPLDGASSDRPPIDAALLRPLLDGGLAAIVPQRDASSNHSDG